MGYTWERFLPPYSLKMARIWQWAGGDAGADGAHYDGAVETIISQNKKTLVVVITTKAFKFIRRILNISPHSTRDHRQRS